MILYKSSKLGAPFILCFSCLFLTRAIWYLLSPLDPLQFQDAGEYIELSKRILNSNWNMDLHRFVRPPGYPLFLAFTEVSFGERWMNAALFLQAVFSVSTGLVLYNLVKLWLGKAAAIGSVFLFSLYPPFFYFNGLLCSESIFLFFFSFTLIAFFRAQQSQSWGWLGMFSLALFAASSFRTAILASAPVFFLWLLIGSERWRKGIVRSVFSLGLFFVFHLPMTIVNYHHHGSWFLASNGGSFLFLNGNSEVGYLDAVRYRHLNKEQRYDVENFSDYGERFFGSDFNRVYELPANERSAVYRKLAFEWIKENPVLWLKIKGSNLLRVLLPGLSPWHWSNSVFIVSFLGGGMFYLLFWIGLIWGYNHRVLLWEETWYWGVMAGQAAALVIFLFTYRYKIFGLEFLLLPVAGLGLASLGALFVPGWRPFFEVDRA